ncbi:hypothetical protein AQUCO_07500017v1 [Aquilegia coerulea]|uniref:Transposase-associated domain-containing protein n=1 Tax=Aquilegia coerulea TaxID=218851 RepID=A0A2G5C958_AQUCA|nr:hypothetical protein AQUCO_07500017v1 [Aquilegia coerulea]
MNSDRTLPVYRNGVKEFIEFARANNDGLTTCPCPCKKCQNRRKAPFDEVDRHLLINGIDTSYQLWTVHGEKPHTILTKESAENVQENMEEGNNQNKEGLGMGAFVDDAYEMHEGAGDFPQGGDDNVIGLTDFEAQNILEPNFGKRYNEYKKKAKEKLYPTCEGPHTTLSAIVELHNIKKQFGWSGASVTALLTILREWFPEGNTFPEKYPTMKAMLKDLGMKTNRIHACENNCILYYKNFENATECSQCTEPRFKEKDGRSKKLGKKETKEPNKVLRHFPLIPYLDSSQWRMFIEKWQNKFAKEGQNVWLGIATDGFNPRGVQSTSYSCWPVFMVPYNLPPSLCMKSEFQIIQRIDIYLQPLVDEMKQLWVGVLTYDAHYNKTFKMKVMLMWGIHDFPAYGNLSGCVTHGYKACPVCGDETPSLRLVNSGKIVYTNYPMFLGRQTSENRPPPKRLNGPMLMQQLNRLNYVPSKIPKRCGKRSHVQDSEGDNSGAEVTKAWYKKSVLFDLEYWNGHQVRHVIDVMHTEMNVAKALICTILDMKDRSKDTVSGREDMRALGIHSNQWLQTDEATGKILKDLKLPSDFSSKLSNIVNLPQLSFHTMKSHDWHVIMQYLLPVLLQHAYAKNRDLRRAVQQISLFFNLLCSKVVVRKEIQEAKKIFPISFFDIMIHLVVHLSDEALICGPTQPRWMYPFERLMKELKSIPKNKRYIEGSIAEAYLVSESVRYAIEYMPNSENGNHKATREAFLDENSEFSAEGPLLDGKFITLRPEQLVQIHRWLLTDGATNSTLWRLVQGPLLQAKTYRKYRVKGFVFSPKYHDDTVVTHDSGVSIKAMTTFTTGRKDKNPIDVWYGIIKEIIELDYTDFKEVVFYCDWVRWRIRTMDANFAPIPICETTTQTGSERCSQTITKRLVTLDEHGISYGENTARWNTRIGHYVRIKIPIIYTNIRKVDKTFLNDIWIFMMVSNVFYVFFPF